MGEQKVLKMFLQVPVFLKQIPELTIILPGQLLTQELINPLIVKQLLSGMVI